MSTATSRRSRATGTSGSPFTPTLVVDNTNGHTTHDRAEQPAESSPEPSPRFPWQHKVVASFGLFLTLVVVADRALHLFDPVTGSILRITAAVVSVAFIVLWVTHRLYLRVEALYESTQVLYQSTRDLVSWFQGRAGLIDQRDRNLHARLDVFGDGQADAVRRIAELRQGIFLLHDDQVDLAGDVGYSLNRVRTTIFQQFASLSGGQAAVAESVDNLAHTVRQLAARLNRGGDSGTGGPGSSEVRQAYLQAYERGERGQEGAVVVPLPNRKAFDLGREVERRRWERGEGGEEYS